MDDVIIAYSAQKSAAYVAYQSARTRLLTDEQLGLVAVYAGALTDAEISSQLTADELAALPSRADAVAYIASLAKAGARYKIASDRLQSILAAYQSSDISEADAIAQIEAVEF